LSTFRGLTFTSPLEWGYTGAAKPLDAKGANHGLSPTDDDPAAADRFARFAKPNRRATRFPRSGKEGRRSGLYGTLTGGAIVGNLLKSFESKYPGVKVKYLRLGGASFVERIRSEARAGRFLWDVATSEYIQFFELMKHASLARYAGPDSASIAPKHRDPNGAWVSLYGAIATIAWNTRMIKA